MNATDTSVPRLVLTIKDYPEMDQVLPLGMPASFMIDTMIANTGIPEEDIECQVVWLH